MTQHSSSLVQIFGKEIIGIAKKKEEEQEDTPTLVCEGALLNALNTSIKGDILSREGTQVI